MIERTSIVATAAICVTLLAGCPDGEADTAEDVGQQPETGDVSSNQMAVSLISHHDWEVVVEGDDPLADHRPDDVDCSEDARKTEMLDGELSYAVDTTDCNYVAISQPTLDQIDAGDTVSIRVWHFSLTPFADGIEEAHAAVLLDGQVIWEEYIDIPADGQLLAAEWEADTELEAGTEAMFHLHNHGNNEWNFIELSVQ